VSSQLRGNRDTCVVSPNQHQIRAFGMTPA
jgi:hypothetical protein